MLKKNNFAFFPILLALCLALSALESFLVAPLSLPLPGVKLGLSNLVILFSLASGGYGAAAFLTVSRSLLTALLFGSPVTLFLSLSGGLISLGVMLCAMPLLRRRYSYITVSILGSLAFQIGQIAASLLLYGTAVLYYLPLLLCVGTIAGALIGALENLLCIRLLGRPKQA